jgi:PGF-pre-PGF domain-containing protein
MSKKSLILVLFLFSVFCILSKPAHAVTAVVDVSKVTDWKVSSFSATDVTYPGTVYFLLEFHNNGTVDLNVSGNLSIKKDMSVVYSSLVFNDSVSAQQHENFTFNWTPTTTGDFLANLTINMTNDALGQSNLTFAVTPFTVYSQPSGPSGPPSRPSYVPPVNVTKTWDVILPFVPVKIEIVNIILAFREIIIEVDKESHNVTVEINKIDERPGWVKKDPPGELYQYLEIKHENLEGNIRKILINFSVKNEWISDKQVSKPDVILNRYSESEEKWESYPAEILEGDSVYTYYRSEVPGLSIFSVTAREKTACTPNERKCSENELQECSFGGLWETIETCEHGCSEGACLIPLPCTPGGRRCLGDTLQECREDGSGWEDVEKCKYGCWDNECKEMLVSFVTRMAVFVMFAILIAIVLIMIGLVYMNIKTFLAGKK